MRHVNQAGLALIKSFEKCVLHPYDDGAGYQTVGWGHLIRRGEHFDAHITQEEADELLRHDLGEAEGAVERQVKVPLSENQFGALVSFTFNVGGGGLGRSSMLRALNRGDYAAVPSRLLVWNKAGGKVLAGLTRRRKAEGKLFVTPDSAAATSAAAPAVPVAAGGLPPSGSATADTAGAAIQPVASPQTVVETAGTVNVEAAVQPVKGGGKDDAPIPVTEQWWEKTKSIPAKIYGLLTGGVTLGVATISEWMGFVKSNAGLVLVLVAIGVIVVIGLFLMHMRYQRNRETQRQKFELEKMKLTIASDPTKINVS